MDGGFLKTSDKLGGGRIFVFHNTILQPVITLDGKESPAGANVGLGWGGPMVNVTSRNNILHVRSTAIRTSQRSAGDYDYDLLASRSAIPEGQEAHGVRGEPIYAEGHGLRQGKGWCQLSPKSPGYDAAVRLPGFNDDCKGKAPDMGAHEAETPAMEFGVDAYRSR
jgi:hypothetical protein